MPVAPSGGLGAFGRGAVVPRHARNIRLKNPVEKKSGRFRRSGEFLTRCTVYRSERAKQMRSTAQSIEVKNAI
jgi:hypothetical protein